MAQLFKILLLFFIIFAVKIGNNHTCFAAIHGALEYKIPIEYSKMNEDDINSAAEFYYNNSLKNKTKEVDENTSNALILSFSVFS